MAKQNFYGLRFILLIFIVVFEARIMYNVDVGMRGWRHDTFFVLLFSAVLFLCS